MYYLKRIFQLFWLPPFNLFGANSSPSFQLRELWKHTYPYPQLIFHITSEHNLPTLFHNHTTLYCQTPKLQIMVNVVFPDAVAAPVDDQPAPPVASIHAVIPSKDKNYYPSMDKFMKVSILVYFSLRLILHTLQPYLLLILYFICYYV